MKDLPFSPSASSRFPLLRGAFEFILEIIKIVVVSLLIIVPVRYFVIQPFYVKGSSMFDSFNNGDYLIINELNIQVRQKPLQRGEVVVFQYPKDPKQYFIKRVIGLPGETVEVKDGGVYIYNTESPQGVLLDETVYLRPGTKTTTNRGTLKMTLPDNEYFVLGDNRSQSLDSRIFGALPYANVIGVTWIRGFPFNRVGIFETPHYNF